MAGCGTYVPGIQEPLGSEVDGQALAYGIAINVKCELQDAVARVYQEYPRTFMDKWGVQITLNLTMDEKGAVSPNVNYTPISPATALFNLGAGGTLSSAATRIDKVSAFYTVRELRDLNECNARLRPGGPMLMQSDLKLREWLFDNLTFSGAGVVAYKRNTPSGPFKQSVISHEVRFEVLTSGSITPALKLTRVAINPSGTFLSASRTRTHSLLVTLGPTDAPAVPVGAPQLGSVVGPSRAAADSHLASEIGLAVGNGLKSALPQ